MFLSEVRNARAKGFIVCLYGGGPLVGLNYLLESKNVRNSIEFIISTRGFSLPWKNL